jgi:hypothetical protein
MANTANARMSSSSSSSRESNPETDFVGNEIKARRKILVLYIIVLAAGNWTTRSFETKLRYLIYLSNVFFVYVVLRAILEEYRHLRTTRRR